MTCLSASPLSNLPSAETNETVPVAADFDEVENDDLSMPDCIGEDCDDCDEESLGEEDLAPPDLTRDVSGGSTLHSSMSLFISGLVGSHGEQQLVVTVDNARPRDLPQPLQDSCSNIKKNAISRWESTPSPNQATTRHAPRRPCPRAMRPLPVANPQDHPMKQISKKTKDTPIMRPQRMDSNRSLNCELSISDLGEIAQRTSSDVPSHQSVRQESMNLDALIAAAAGESEGGDVYVKVPALAASENSFWGSASTVTMTASFMNQSVLFKPSDESHRSLFDRSEPERPMRCPRRTRSGEQHGPPLDVPSVVTDSPNSAEKPMRRPVRKSSDRYAHQNKGVVTPPPLLLDEETLEENMPGFLHYSTLTTLKEESSACSFKLSRSSSEQSLMKMPEQSLTRILVTGNKKFDNKESNHLEEQVGRFAFKRAESEPIMSPEDDLNYMADNSATKRCRRM